MGLVEHIKPGDCARSVRQAIAKLSSTKLGPTSKPTFAGLTLTAPLTVPYGGTGLATLTDHGILLGSGTGAITPLGVAANGQIPIGSTGADPVLATITGTANRITVSNAAGSITLSGPQDIHTGASPTFAGLTSTGQVSIYHAGNPLTLLNSTSEQLSLFYSRTECGYLSLFLENDDEDGIEYVRIEWESVGTTPENEDGKLVLLVADGGSLSDVVTITKAGMAVSGNVTGANLNISNWNTAYGWGDHAGLYLTDAGTPTDNTLVRFDGTDGVTTQTCGIVVDDSDNVSGIGTLGAGVTTIDGDLVLTGSRTIRSTSSLLLRSDGILSIGYGGVDAINIGRTAASIPISLFGSVIAKIPTDSATAYQFQNAAGTPILIVDTTNSKVDVAGTIRTAADQDWNLGTASAQADFAGDTKIRVTIGGSDYDLVALAA